ncbi:Snt-6 [Aphelenchoides fujianensis]|nr:Snt-6 [Aphelenchoides fujianensis]
MFYNETVAIPVFVLYAALLVVGLVFAALFTVYHRNRRYYEQFDLDQPPHGYDELPHAKHVNWADSQLQSVMVAGQPQPIQPNLSFRSKLKDSLPWKSASQHVIDTLKPQQVEEYRGRLNFSLSHNADLDILYVNLIQAIDLPVRDFTGSSDPYVRVFFAEEPSKSQRTKIHHRNLSPKFQQTLAFAGHSMKKLQDMNLVMQVMDYDRFSSDDPIGEIMLPMRNVNLGKNPVYWKHLQRPTISREQAGEVMLTLCYLPESNKMNVTLLKAKDLPSRGREKIGVSDPYVKLWLVQKGSKLEKRKTTVKPQTKSPVFNEMFTFSVPCREKLEKEINLVVSVMDYDPISSNDEIGHCVVGLLGRESAVKQWREAIHNPETSVTSTHQLAPRW